MTTPIPTLKKTVTREAFLLAYLLLSGLLLLPIAIYLVGQIVFGAYGGTGLTDFFERIFRGIVHAEGVIWFLVLSPYLGWQVLRLTIWAFRRLSPPTDKRPR